MSWFQIDGETTILTVHAQPGAKRTEIQGLHGEALKIRVASPPVDGRANDELQRFLAEQFRVPRRDVTVSSGESSRHKQLRIVGSAINPQSLLP